MSIETLAEKTAHRQGKQANHGRHARSSRAWRQSRIPKTLSGDASISRYSAADEKSLWGLTEFARPECEQIAPRLCLVRTGSTATTTSC